MVPSSRIAPALGGQALDRINDDGRQPVPG
jgi:hypothetical protein